MKGFNMNITGIRSASIFVAACFVAGSSFSEQTRPNSQYFRGVEDRIEIADLIVVAAASLIGTPSKRLGDPTTVEMQLDVKEVVKGCYTNAAIKYPVVLHQYGMSSFVKPKIRTFSAEDKIAVLMAKHIPSWRIGRKEKVVVFFVENEQKIRPYCVYWDSLFRESGTCIPLIINAEKTRKEQSSVSHVEVLLSAGQEKMTKQYAIRAILKSDMPWAEICSMFSRHADALATPYAAGAIASYCELYQIKGDDLEVGAELMRSILSTLSDEQEKECFLSTIKKIYPALVAQMSKKKGKVSVQDLSKSMDV